MFRWVRLISVADLFTLANGLIGFLAVIYILDGSMASLYAATMLIFLAMLMDGLDGAIARRLGSKHTMGRYLDTISDTISFCIAPALMLYRNFYDGGLGVSSALRDPVSALAVAVSMMVLGFGILRLSRFARGGHKFRNFRGVPTPAMTFFVFTACMVFGRVPPFIFRAWYIVLPLTAVISVFMVMDLQYPKVRPKKRNFIIISALVALMVVPTGLAWFIYVPLYYLLIKWVVLITFISIACYLLFGPLYIRLIGSPDSKEESSAAQSDGVPKPQ